MIDDIVHWDDDMSTRNEYATSRSRTTDGYVWSNLYDEAHDMMMGTCNVNIPKHDESVIMS